MNAKEVLAQRAAARYFSQLTKKPGVRRDFVRQLLRDQTRRAQRDCAPPKTS